MDEASLARLMAMADALRAEGSGASADLARRFEFVVDLLVQRGLLTAGHRRLIGKIGDARPTVRLATFRDKRSLPPIDIDCAAHLPLCQGRCCTFALTLAAEDVREGRLQWDLLEPYTLPKLPSGYCVHHDPRSGCTVYDDRPATCRVYDCREDRRVWLDYDNRVPAPMPAGVTPIVPG